MEERLQKYLAEKGIASRRKCEEYILQGLVKVNGNIVTQLGTKIDPTKDKIIFKDQELTNQKEKKVYKILKLFIIFYYNFFFFFFYFFIK